jgi:heme/copper-type cytochrome/quinol oxidase subunit 3
MMKTTNTMTQRLANININVLGMALFLLNETVFFAVLIVAFVNYQAGVIHPPNAATSLHPYLTLFFSLFLFGSSGTIFMADRSLERKNHTGVVIWLIATVVLGAIFLVGQGIEYLDLLNSNIKPSTNLFGTTFFTLTGFHGLHVFIGLVMLTILVGFALKGDFKNGKSSAMSAISLYWHFVDAVWVVIFSLVYIWAANMFNL